MVRKAFKRKKLKYIGLLPILGGVLPDQNSSVFSLKKNLFYLKNDLYAQKNVNVNNFFPPVMTTPHPPRK